MRNKNWLIKTGNFFFKWRNFVFPLMLLVLFISWMPPAEYIGSYWLEDFKDIAAGLLIAGGLVFRGMTIGWAYIKRGGINKQVYAQELVTQGFFGLCRNPLYVGNMIIYAGVFILHGQPAVIVLGIIFYLFIYKSIVAAEEYYLERTFGFEYLEYCRHVPRWIPRISNYKTAMENMSFNIKRSIAKDYTTIFNAGLAIVTIEIIESLVFYPGPEFLITLQTGGAVLAILFACVVAIKTMKKYSFWIHVEKI